MCCNLILLVKVIFKWDFKKQNAVAIINISIKILSDDLNSHPGQVAIIMVFIRYLIYHLSEQNVFWCLNVECCRQLLSVSVQSAKFNRTKFFSKKQQQQL